MIPSATLKWVSKVCRRFLMSFLHWVCCQRNSRHWRLNYKTLFKRRSERPSSRLCTTAFARACRVYAESAEMHELCWYVPQTDSAD